MAASTTGGWSGHEKQEGKAAVVRKPGKAIAPHPVPPCAFKQCDFCHGGSHSHPDVEEPHPCTYPAQSAIAAHEILQHLSMVPRLVPACSTARVHRFFADWNILAPSVGPNGSRIVPIYSDSLGDLTKLHSVEGYHMLPRRIFASYSAHNMQLGFAVNLETPIPGTKPGAPAQFKSWAAENCSVTANTNGSLQNVGLVVRDGHVQNELVYEMRLPPCEGAVHPLLALAALDLNDVERRIQSENTLSLATNEDSTGLIVTHPHQVVIAAAGDVSEPVIDVTSERRGRATQHVYTLRDAAQKENYLLSIGENDATGARPKISMHPIGVFDGMREALRTEAKNMRCAAMRFSVEFTVVFNEIPGLH